MQFNALSFGERLKIERERLGLSQLEAAESCGVRREMWVNTNVVTLSLGLVS